MLSKWQLLPKDNNNEPCFLLASMGAQAAAADRVLLCQLCSRSGRLRAHWREAKDKNIFEGSLEIIQIY